MNLTQQYLKECFDYDPKTGLFIWRHRPIHHFKTLEKQKAFNKSHVGKYVRVNGNPEDELSRPIVCLSPYAGSKTRSYLLNRLVYLWHTGQTPPHMGLLPKDGNRFNTRIENLYINDKPISSLTPEAKQRKRHLALLKNQKNQEVMERFAILLGQRRDVYHTTVPQILAQATNKQNLFIHQNLWE